MTQGVDRFTAEHEASRPKFSELRQAVRDFEIARENFRDVMDIFEASPTSETYDEMKTAIGLLTVAVERRRMAAS